MNGPSVIEPAEYVLDIEAVFVERAIMRNWDLAVCPEGMHALILHRSVSRQAMSLLLEKPVSSGPSLRNRTSHDQWPTMTIANRLEFGLPSVRPLHLGTSLAISLPAAS